ncbi:hypothetical protein F1559_002866 [Cyanidiococcus yangmingshanensis]|uniref:Mediator of RNA polymerase II transcription subunit 18 n=1 Tax=Cyanidiococcus yangmingshanensis TaxID=2690220 RepID=A0A7J7IMR1_9RHOD|nr:hypothetical protein F1559_002866 [Cyanidiococcus yangmingshanensis]
MSLQEFTVRGVIDRDEDCERVLRCLAHLVPSAGILGAFSERERRYRPVGASNMHASNLEARPEVVVRFNFCSHSVGDEAVAQVDMYGQTVRRAQSSVTVRQLHRTVINASDATRFVEIFLQGTDLAFEWVRRGRRFRFRDGVFADVFRLECVLSNVEGHIRSEPLPDLKWVVELRYIQPLDIVGIESMKSLSSALAESLPRKLALLAPYVFPLPKLSDKVPRDVHIL